MFYGYFLFQLRDVFDACDTEGHGLISLNELGNISRSHVGRGQVDQILEILGPGGDEDKIDFEQFYQKFVEFMKQGVNINEEEEDTTQQVVEEEGLTKTSNHKADGGVFNENLKRAIEKNVPYKTSPNKQAAQRNLRRKSSQVSFLLYINILSLLSICCLGVFRFYPVHHDHIQLVYNILLRLDYVAVFPW
jgi:hypothetical protein